MSTATSWVPQETKCTRGLSGFSSLSSLADASVLYVKSWESQLHFLRDFF